MPIRDRAARLPLPIEASLVRQTARQGISSATAMWRQGGSKRGRDRRGKKRVGEEKLHRIRGEWRERRTSWTAKRPKMRGNTQKQKTNNAKRTRARAHTHTHTHDKTTHTRKNTQTQAEPAGPRKGRREDRAFELVACPVSEEGMLGLDMRHRTLVPTWVPTRFCCLCLHTSTRVPSKVPRWSGCARHRESVTKEGRGGGWRGLLTMVICCSRRSHARHVPH